MVLHLLISKGTPSRQSSLAIPTNYPSISAEAPFFHDDLVCIPLQCLHRIRRLCEDQSSVFRFFHKYIFVRSHLVEEAMIPDLFLRLPIHKLTTFHRSSESGFAPLGYVVLLRCNVSASISCTSEGVGYCVRPFERIGVQGRPARSEACFD